MPSRSPTAPAHSPDDPRPWRFVLVLTLIAAAVRLSIVEFPAADLLAPVTDGREHSSHGEEIARGTIAHELLNGPLVPVIDYQWASFFGGSLVTGILAMPWFLLLGSTLFALKLVPVLVSLCSPLLAFLILDRSASRRAACIGALLLALPSPGYTVFTTIAWGTHMEGSVLALLCIWLYVRARTSSKATLRNGFLLGLALGFSLYYGYSALLTLATLALFELGRDKLFVFTRGFASGALGFGVGLSPWWAYNLRNDFAGLTLYDDHLLQHLLPRPDAFLLEGVGALLIEKFPQSLGMRDLGPISGGALNLVLAATIYAFVLLTIWSLRAPAQRLVRGFLARRAQLSDDALNLIFPLHVALFGCVYVVSWFFRPETPEQLGAVRYLIIPYPTIALTLAVGADRFMAQESSLRRLAQIGLASLVLLFSVGAVRLMDSERGGLHRAANAVDLREHARWIVLRFGTDPDRLREIVQSVITTRSAEQRDELLTGMGRSLLAMSVGRRNVGDEGQAVIARYRATRNALLSDLPAEYRRYFEGADVRPRLR